MPHSARVGYFYDYNSHIYTYQPWLICVDGGIIYIVTAYNKKLYYKGIRVGAFGLPILSDENKSRIKKKNRKRDFYNTTFNSPFKNSDTKNLIVMYDIPADLRNERDWLRRHLVKFGYLMIQKSVWVGPSPLPKSFLEYLKEIKIGNNLKTFKLAKSYDSKNKNI